MSCPGQLKTVDIAKRNDYFLSECGVPCQSKYACVIKISPGHGVDMRLQRQSWQLCLFLLSFLLSSSVSLSLDTFQDVKVSGCTCKFAITLTDDGLDAKNSACNKKCSKKNLAATLGGPASVSNLYKIQFNVVRGSVTILKLTATLVSASESSTHEPTTPEGTEGSYKPFPGFHPKGGPYCDRFVNECLDTSSYPNIG